MADVRSAPIASIAVIAAGAALLGACAIGSGTGGAPPRQELDAGENGVAYVDDASCADCHAREHAAWSGSHHDLAMQEATAETVLGDFDGATFTHFGVTSRFFTRDGRFFVNTEGPDGQLADFELAYTFGVEPLQQYLAPFPGGYLQSLTIAWDTERGEWFHLYPDQAIPPDDPLHWTGRYQRWNVMCAGVPLDVSAPELRPGERYVPHHLGRDRRRMPGLPRSGRRARRPGARRSHGVGVDTGGGGPARRHRGR